MEEWKAVENFPDYEISTLGNIRSKGSYHKRKGKRLLKPWNNGTGYLIIKLCDGQKKQRCVGIARLVAGAFVSNPDNKPEVNHKNGKKYDNFYLNLEWVTRKENALHAYHNGLMPYKGGEKCPLARFTEDQIRLIRQIYRDNPKMTYVELGKQFNASGSTIGKIILRQRWKHIE